MRAVQQQEVRLAARAIHVVPDAAGRAIVCVRGSLWITLDHDVRDIVLEAGERFVTREHKRALVYAFRPSTLVVGAPAAQPSILRRLSKKSSDCSRSPSVWAPTRAASSG